jgi:hypothetical protein
MRKKNAPATKRSKVTVKDLAAKTNPKGGLTLTTAPTSLRVRSPATAPALTAKGTDVAMESLVLSTERLDLD